METQTKIKKQKVSDHVIINSQHDIMNMYGSGHGGWSWARPQKEKCDCGHYGYRGAICEVCENNKKR